MRIAQLQSENNSLLQKEVRDSTFSPLKRIRRVNFEKLLIKIFHIQYFILCRLDSLKKPISCWMKRTFWA